MAAGPRRRDGPHTHRQAPHERDTDAKSGAPHAETPRKRGRASRGLERVHSLRSDRHFTHAHNQIDLRRTDTLNPVTTQSRRVLADDTDAVRQLIELGSLDHDLAEAQRAFTRAQDALSDDPALAAMATDAGVVVYGRCFHSSNRRRRLDEFITVPGHLQGVHEAIMVLRNRTVAHSESAQQPTHPFIELESDEDGQVAVQRVVAMTVRLPVPIWLPHRALALIQELRDGVADALAPVEATVIAEASPRAATLWTNGHLPQLVPTAESWRPGQRRERHPARAEIHIPLGDLS